MKLFPTLKKAVLALSITATATALLAPHLHAAEERNYLLATASTGGTYYPVGVALSTLTKVKLQPKQKINLSAINSAGSGENVKLLRENEAQFAILQGLYGKYAWEGTGPLTNDGPQRELRAVTMLWQNVEHFVIEKEYAKTGTITDMMGLKGQSMAMGKKNSGTLGSNKTLLGNLGMNIESDLKLMHAGYGPSATALQDGKVSGMGAPGGVPLGALINAFSKKGSDLTILEFTKSQLKAADGGMNLWTPYTIKAGTYPGLTEDIQTIAQPNFLAVRADIDEEAVYLITKTMYENLPFLNSIHKATKAMSIEKALAGLPMPLHPGAERYFREVGVKIPKALVAQR